MFSGPKHHRSRQDELRRSFYLQLAPEQRDELRKSFSRKRRPGQPDSWRRRSASIKTLSTGRIHGSTLLRKWRYILGVAAFCEFGMFLLLPHLFLHDGGEQEHEIEHSFAEEMLDAISVLYFIDVFVRAQEAWKKAVRAEERRMGKDKEQPNSRLKLYLYPWLLYVSVLLFYLEILPVGFHRRLFQRASSAYSTYENVFGKAISVPGYKHYSPAYAVGVHSTVLLYTSIRARAKVMQTRLIRKVRRRLAVFAIGHPFLFVRRLRGFRTAVRWVKYSEPIGEHVMNSDLIGNIRDMVKRAKQRGKSQYACWCRRAAWVRLDDKSRRELAVCIIQRTYRSYRSRKWVRLIRMAKQKREEKIIKLVQSAVRLRLADERVNREEREAALEKLLVYQQQDKLTGRRLSTEISPYLTEIGGFNVEMSIAAGRRNSKPIGKTEDGILDEEDGKRINEIQNEIRNMVKAEKQRLMLLRPDSRFAVYWQVVYVFCAVIEALKLVLKPRLDASTVFPDGLWEVEMLLRFIIIQSETIVGIVLCLDVFISLVTGELDPVTGSLKPKSFFGRWIYPGLLMHLVVNPKMSEVSDLAKSGINLIHEAGPGRVWRWFIYLFFPIWDRVVVWFEWQIWVRLVHNENLHRVGR